MKRLDWYADGVAIKVTLKAHHLAEFSRDTNAVSVRCSCGHRVEAADTEATVILDAYVDHVLEMIRNP